MQELGLIEGRDIDVVHRGADGHVDRLPMLAAELVEFKPKSHCCIGNDSGACGQESNHDNPNCCSSIGRSYLPWFD